MFNTRYIEYLLVSSDNSAVVQTNNESVENVYLREVNVSRAGYCQSGNVM